MVVVRTKDRTDVRTNMYIFVQIIHKRSKFVRDQNSYFGGATFLQPRSHSLVITTQEIDIKTTGYAVHTYTNDVRMNVTSAGSKLQLWEAFVSPAHLICPEL